MRSKESSFTTMVDATVIYSKIIMFNLQYECGKPNKISGGGRAEGRIAI